MLFLDHDDVSVDEGFDYDDYNQEYSSHSFSYSYSRDNSRYSNYMPDPNQPAAGGVYADLIKLVI